MARYIDIIVVHDTKISHALWSFWCMDSQCMFMHQHVISRYEFSIESHFVGVHGPYELHRKEEQI